MTLATVAVAAGFMAAVSSFVIEWITGQVYGAGFTRTVQGQGWQHLFYVTVWGATVVALWRSVEAYYGRSLTGYVAPDPAAGPPAETPSARWRRAGAGALVCGGVTLIGLITAFALGAASIDDQARLVAESGAVLHGLLRAAGVGLGLWGFVMMGMQRRTARGLWGLVVTTGALAALHTGAFGLVDAGAPGPASGGTLLWATLLGVGVGLVALLDRDAERATALYAVASVIDLLATTDLFTPEGPLLLAPGGMVIVKGSVLVGIAVEGVRAARRHGWGWSALARAVWRARPEEAPAVGADADDRLERCLNCGRALSGPYCERCGQKGVDRNRPFADLLSELAEIFLDIDARLYRTVRPLLVRPGHLTRSYNAGQRQRYLHPLRLYVFSSLIFFLMLTYLGTGPSGGSESARPPAAPADTTVQGQPADTTAGPGGPAAPDTAQDRPDTTAQPPRTEAPRGGRGETPRNETQRGDTQRPSARGETATGGGGLLGGFFRSYAEGFQQEDGPSSSARSPVLDFAARLAAGESGAVQSFYSNLSRAMFVLLPVFAVLLLLLFPQPDTYYIAHLILALHVHTFGFLILTVSILVAALVPGGLGQGVQSGLGAATLVYLFVGLRRVYEETWPRTLLKGTLLVGAYAVLLLATSVATFLLTALL